MKRYFFLVIFFLLVFLVSLVFAQVSRPHYPMIVNIDPSGHALIRGTVESKSANSFTLKSWGGTWNVNLSTSTKRDEVEVGDFVGVLGKISTSSNWTINAKLVKNWSVKTSVLKEATSTKSKESHRPKRPQATSTPTTSTSTQ